MNMLSFVMTLFGVIRQHVSSCEHCTGQVSAGALATRRFGATMYRIMFWEFSELYHRQEVVGALLTHAGAGSEAETDCSLSALSALAAASADSR